MKLEYSYKFSESREEVWNFMQNEDVLRNSLPGCKSFEKDPEKVVYISEMGISIGPIKGIFYGEVKQLNQEKPAYYKLKVHGKGKPGEIDATADMFLEEEEDGTRVDCKADAQVTGVLASAGQRVMNGAAKLILGQFFKAVDQEMKKTAEKNA
jgi:carbon monoxide dehydrogenase subunit G